jgi:amino acid transporter
MASYIGIPIFIVPIVVWKLVYRTRVSGSVTWDPGWGGCLLTLLVCQGGGD